MPDYLEDLLNRANNTISDLPDSKTWDELSSEEKAERTSALRNHISSMGWHQSDAYILHLTDIIDRLAWALDNTLSQLEAYNELVRSLAEYGPSSIKFYEDDQEDMD